MNSHNTHLSDVLREILSFEVETLVQKLLDKEADLFLVQQSENKARTELSRAGHQKKRRVETNIGSIYVKLPKFRNNKKYHTKVRSGYFNSSFFPRYKRKVGDVKIENYEKLLSSIIDVDGYLFVESVFGADVSKSINKTLISMLEQDILATVSIRDSIIREEHWVVLWCESFSTNNLRSPLESYIIVAGTPVKGSSMILDISKGDPTSTEEWLIRLRKLKYKGLNTPNYINYLENGSVRTAASCAFDKKYGSAIQ